MVGKKMIAALPEKRSIRSKSVDPHRDGLKKMTALRAFFNKDLPPSHRPGERLSLKKRPRNHQAAIPANKIQWAG
ncbi:MAG: hypothetical protein C6W57_15195 [Caldibacillus debilis]|nr:MAG: hypothetical protein C6W57_15195 [Caldibacillus debilis]